MQEDVFKMYLDEVEGIESLSPDENRMLAEKLSAGHESVKDRLIEGNLRTVLLMVQDYLGRGVLAGDLVQEANMALVVAVREYRSELGGFDEFLEEQVRKALLAAVEEQSREEKTAEKMVDRVNTLKDLSRDMAEELGREATVEELARRMELTADEIRDIMKMTLDAMSVMGE
ncbi:MAG: sigma-70 family RNA polymerase sigma factor [Hungatella sp.]|nr:sigma-70 family RNA polymerase sigma factor [Hungatella sp.]